ncbi:UNVERIFIED_CONTAM: hypothetical protein K2H54_003402 [Gekko kuhli]
MMDPKDQQGKEHGCSPPHSSPFWGGGAEFGEPCGQQPCQLGDCSGGRESGLTFWSPGGIAAGRGGGGGLMSLRVAEGNTCLPSDVDPIQNDRFPTWDSPPK